MRIAKHVIVVVLASLSIGGVLSCSRLTDPTYEFMTLQAIDGKPLPVSIRFGPDSAMLPVTRGRLGFANASLGLPCRVEAAIGHVGFVREGHGSITHPRCESGGDDPVIAEVVLTHMIEDFHFITSGSHTFTFSGRIRTKSPDF